MLSPRLASPPPATEPAIDTVHLHVERRRSNWKQKNKNCCCSVRTYSCCHSILSENELSCVFQCWGSSFTWFHHKKTHSCTSCLLPYILCVFSRFVNSRFTDWFKTIIKNKHLTTMSGSKLTWCPLANILEEEGSFFITGQRETGNRTDPFQFPIITAGTFLHGSHNSTQTRPPPERHQHSFVMKFPFISFTQDFPAAHLLTFNKLDN